MEVIVTEELLNEYEFDEYLKDNKLVIPNYHYAVIALLTDVNRHVILQRRGPKSRDDSNMLADIGGAVEKDDLTFRDALYREIYEEVGNKANIEIDKFVGCFLQKKYEPRSKCDVNWLFMVYKCNYIDGELLINENGKCLGYELFDINNLPKSEMLETTKSFWDFYLKTFW